MQSIIYTVLIKIDMVSALLEVTGKVPVKISKVISNENLPDPSSMTIPFNEQQQTLFYTSGSYPTIGQGTEGMIWAFALAQTHIIL